MPGAPDPVSVYEARKRVRPPFALRPGYEVRVHGLLKEGDKERTQVFEGIVTAISGQGLGKTFTVRRVTAGVGIERIFPMFSPLLTKVDVVRATKVRRAKLTYLRTQAVQKRRKEDAGLMRKVEAERAAARKTKEETEAKERAERAESEKAAKEAALQKAAEVSGSETPQESAPPEKPEAQKEH